MSTHPRISSILVSDVEAFASALTGNSLSRGSAPTAARNAGGASSPQSSVRIHHLGKFDGECMRRSRGYREDYGCAKALASLAVVASLLFVVALICGAV